MLNNKKVILGLVLLFVSLIIVLIYVFNKNNTYKIGSDIKTDGFFITDTSIKYNNGITTISGNISSDGKRKIKYIEIILKDKKQKYTLVAYVGDEVTNKKSNFASSINKDFSNLKNADFKVIK